MADPSSPAPLAAGLADDWWYWALAATLFASVAALSGSYRSLAARLRAAAVSRGIVKLPPGQTFRRMPLDFWSDLSWLALITGVWVVAAPWTWGYDDANGAIATDVVTGAVVIVLGLAAIVLPALWSINVLAGLWLVVAPWLVGYGDASGPVGLSDTLAGLVVSAVSIASLATSQRALRPGGQPIGRIRPRRQSGGR